MNFTPILLWSDLLLFLLIAVCGLYAWMASKHAHLRAPWIRVRRNAAGLASATVLIPFALIGVLDSLHYRPLLESKAGTATARYSVEVKSALDAVLGAALGNMIGKSEKTYSDPLATHAFSKETIDVPGSGGAKQVREYPRLANGGAHLKDPAAEWARDVAIHAARGLVLGAVVWLGLAFVLLALVQPGAAASLAGGSPEDLPDGLPEGLPEDLPQGLPQGLPYGLPDGLPAVPAAARATPGAAARRTNPLIDFWRAVWAGETGTPWRAVLITLLVICMLAGVAVTLGSRYHLLGTDKVGQDVLYLSLKSIRTGLLIGTLTTLVMLPLGVLLGITAGYFRGWVDDVIQYIYTTLNSVPGVLLIAASVLMMQVYIDTHPQLFQTAVERADFRLLALCFILGVTSWTGLCRLLRGETLKLRELEYVQAAQAFGVSRLRIIVRHLLPNVMHIVIISAVMDFSGMVLTEAVLSYVGVGVDPTMTSFGSMINAARMEMSREPMVWWSLAAAFFFMFTLVLAANLFADAVRDAFDPRLVVKRPRINLIKAAAK